MEEEEEPKRDIREAFDFATCGVCLCYFLPLVIMMFTVTVNLSYSLDAVEQIDVQGLM